MNEYLSSQGCWNIDAYNKKTVLSKRNTIFINNKNFPFIIGVYSALIIYFQSNLKVQTSKNLNI